MIHGEFASGPPPNHARRGRFTPASGVTPKRADVIIADVRVSLDEQTRREACALEPIRTPGSVQPHGVLMVVNAASLQIRHVSDNSAALLGLAPEWMLGRTLLEVLDATALAQLTDILDPAVPAANPAPVTLNGTAFDAILHRIEDHILIDWEPALGQAASWSTAVLYAAIHHLARIRTATELWAATALAVRQITGFDHVMIYHFHDDDHGEIVGEDLAEGMQPYFGLHYPASDIPHQARELYLRKLSRVIATTGDEPSALISAVDSDSATSGDAHGLDVSMSELRSVSPQHLQFMRNMGQASTLSFSLIYDDRLIGMITCAHRTPRRVPFMLRQGLEILANQVAAQLSSIASIAVLTRRMEVRSVRSALIAGLTDEADIAETLLRGPMTVLDFIPADGAVIRLDGVITSCGRTPAVPELSALTDALLRRGDSVKFVTDALPLDYPDLARLAPAVCGMLMVPIGGDGDYVAWFRNELVRSVSWLGDQTAANRLTPLSPRNSFSSWSQDVTGTAASWDGLELDAAELGLDLDSTLFRRAESRLAHVALHDPLTGLPNRRLLMDRLQHALAKYERGAELAVLFIDLDGFKSVNDARGHEAGDAVLVHTAQRLVAAVRAQDTVARIGGDEFIVLCEDTSVDDAETLARRILTALRAGPRSGRPAHAPITASIGITGADLSFDASDLLRQADAAMYRAKAQGRNQISR